MIQSKLAYKKECCKHGIKVKAYHANNGIFTSAAFLQELEKEEQSISVSGVGAHHQNPHAEQAIQTVVYIARTMMLHSQICWPTKFDFKLWPFALEYACWVYNNLPNKCS